MQFLKSFGRGVSGLVFRTSLLFLAVFGPLVMVFGTSGQIKQSLEESKLYDSVATTIIDSASKESAGQGVEQSASPFQQQAVQDAAKKALSPTFLQTSTEQIIDGIYGWLQQKTPQPEFSIDISAPKQQFINSVGDYAVERASQLPICTIQQLRQLEGDPDPLTAPCVPSGFDVSAWRAQVEAELNKPSESGETNILQQSTLSPETLPKDENGKTAVQNLTENADNLPKVFGVISMLPWIFTALAVVSALSFVLLQDDKRHGANKLAITMVVIGGLLLLGILLTNFFFGKVASSEAIAQADANLQQPLSDLVRSLSGAFNQRLSAFGIGYAILGAGIFAWLYFTKPKDETNDKTSSNPEAKPDANKEPKSETNPEPKPGPKPTTKTE